MVNIPSQSALQPIDIQSGPKQNEKFKDAMDALFGNKNLSMKTDLKPHQIVQFAQARLFAKRYKSPTMNAFVTYLEKYSVSKNRKGRSESVDIHKSSQDNSLLDDSIRGKLFGG